MMNEVELDGVVQADETFTTVLYKDNHKVLTYHVLLTNEEREQLNVAFQKNKFVFL